MKVLLLLTSSLLVIWGCTKTITTPPITTIVRDTVYRDTSTIGVPVALSSVLTDNSLILQKVCDSLIQNGQSGTNIEVQCPTGYFRFTHPIILQRYDPASGGYYAFTIRIFGNNTAGSASGYGTILDFSAVTQDFAFGIQGGKGCEIGNMNVIGAWNYTFTTPYEFYYGSPLGNNSCRNTNYSPNAAFVIDPFGPYVPSDGGYPGTDAYGNSLQTYYRGNYSGSTGTSIHDVQLNDWLIGFITSPNGYTANGEDEHFYNLNLQNVRFPFIGCQPQEKQNDIDHVQCWGTTEIFIQLGTYGAGAPGNYYVDSINIAGYVRSLAYINEGGYYPSYFNAIYAESLGSLGYISSGLGTTFNNSTINFADYYSTGAYTPNQITSSGVTYTGDQFRMYGDFKPVNINNLNGYNTFIGCSFECVPYWNTDYPTGSMSFQRCYLDGSMADTIFSNPVPIDSTAPGQEPDYLLTVNNQQVVVQCVGNELQRVTIGSPILAYNALSVTQGIIGIVTAVTSNTFTISYISPSIMSGQNYYLYLWEQN